MRSMAASLQRSPSTISREIKRNGGYAGYRATHADQAAWDRAHRPKPCKLERIQRFDVLWQESSDATGRPNKSPVG